MSPSPAALPDVARARAWCRVDLAGGTLDIWPLGLLHAGACTVNLAIDVAARVRLERRDAGFRLVDDQGTVEALTAEELAAHPDAALAGLVADRLGLPPVRLELASGSPRGGGLGASSALVVALIAAGDALVGRPPRAPALCAALARDLEAQLMDLPTGTQDHYPALLGGALVVHHRPGGEEVERLPVDLEALGRHLVVAYTGQSHFSAAANWSMVRRRLDGEGEIRRLFDGIAGAASAVAEALAGGDLRRVGELMGEEWALRRQLSPEVPTPAIDDLLAGARRQGAWGGKACGAGGGGCIALLCPAERRAEVAAGLSAAGATVLPARPTAEPLELEVE